VAGKFLDSLSYVLSSPRHDTIGLPSVIGSLLSVRWRYLTPHFVVYGADVIGSEATKELLKCLLIVVMVLPSGKVANMPGPFDRSCPSAVRILNGIVDLNWHQHGSSLRTHPFLL
jgi:hypothetical protein